MIKVSVIVPVYNAAAYLERCVTSLLQQTLTDIEVLLIDDGSPDGTASVVKEKQQEYPGQLHLIERQGKLGLGTAYLS